VVKDDESTATVLATEEHYDRQQLKEYDAQITLALDSSQDQKLELGGRLRRRSMAFRCNVYAADKAAPNSDSGRVMRDKVTEQVNAIIRENRTLPHQTIYNFHGLGYPSGDPHKAFAAYAAAELAPSDSSWAELSTAQYQKVWSSDDVWFTKAADINQYPMMLFRFKLGAREQCVKKLVLSFEGYGTAPAGNGITVKVWNHVASEWQQAQMGTGSGDETVTITLSEDWPDFIDADGYVWLLARTTNPSNESYAAILYCDFVECIMQVYGITYCDVVSYRNVDVTDVKPFLFKTEFLLRGWLFETVSG
jgi:hypothetical protein